MGQEGGMCLEHYIYREPDQFLALADLTLAVAQGSQATADVPLQLYGWAWGIIASFTCVAGGSIPPGHGLVACSLR